MNLPYGNTISMNFGFMNVRLLYQLQRIISDKFKSVRTRDLQFILMYVLIICVVYFRRKILLPVGNCAAEKHEN